MTFKILVRSVTIPKNMNLIWIALQEACCNVLGTKLSNASMNGKSVMGSLIALIGNATALPIVP